jgi:hypothetical protein
VGDAKTGPSGLGSPTSWRARASRPSSLTVGPFSFSIGQYSKVTGDNEGDIADKAMQWLTIGVKGTFGF